MVWSGSIVALLVERSYTHEECRALSDQSNFHAPVVHNLCSLIHVYSSSTYHATPHKEPGREEKRDYKVQQNSVSTPTNRNKQNTCYVAYLLYCTSPQYFADIHILSIQCQTAYKVHKVHRSHTNTLAADCNPFKILI